MNRSFFNFQLAMEGVMMNKLRAFLTALGIIFGVAAVIAMLAIGTGAKQALLDQMKLIGTNNISIKSVIPEDDEVESGGGNNAEDKQAWSPGLTLKDMEAIQKTIPNVDLISPEIILPTTVIQAGKLQKSKVVGVTNAFFELNKIELANGQFFHDKQMEGGKPICIIGNSIKNKFFPEDNPIGKKIKCGKTWLTVKGVLRSRNIKEESQEKLGIRDYNADIYVPVQTALIRFKNRSTVTKDDIKSNGGFGRNNNQARSKNYHQLDKLTVRIDDTKKLESAANVIGRILSRKHGEVLDYEIKVPYVLLQGEQKTQDTFNWVLAAIAGISLLVGGIGIMNIMLASVLERIKEIGVRRSLGANRKDITQQFLFEAIFISLTGGLIGVVLGVLVAHLIAQSADIPTVVSVWSVALSFGVAAIIGLVFGLIPARKAAKQDPIKALRTD